MRLTFEYGTLILRATNGPIRELPENSGLVFDPRIGSHRAPPYQLSEVVRSLSEHGVRFSDDVRTQKSFAPKISPPSLLLRPYQETAVTAWETAGRRGILVMPTGSGKTRTAIAAIARTGVSTLCLVPTIVLLEQWQKELERTLGVEVGKLGGGAHEIRPVTVTTFESAFRHMQMLGNRFELLVIDEAHHFGARIRDEALEMSIAPFRLGLSATPPTEPLQLTRLFELIGSIVFEVSIPELTGGFLAPFDRVTLAVDLSLDERRAYDRDMAIFRPVYLHHRTLAPETSWSEFVRFAQRTEPGRRALAAHARVRHLVAYTRGKSILVGELLNRHRNSRSIIFTADNETTYAIAREHLVMPITCEIGRMEREDALSRFSNGRLRALVSARVLNEGIDVPDAEVGIIVSAAFGERERVQRVGRLLRPAAGKRAVIYELLAHGTAEERKAEKRTQNLGQTRSLLVQHRREFDSSTLPRRK